MLTLRLPLRAGHFCGSSQQTRPRICRSGTIVSHARRGRTRPIQVLTHDVAMQPDPVIQPCQWLPFSIANVVRPSEMWSVSPDMATTSSVRRLCQWLKHRIAAKSSNVLSRTARDLTIVAGSLNPRPTESTPRACTSAEPARAPISPGRYSVLSACCTEI